LRMRATKCSVAVPSCHQVDRWVVAEIFGGGHDPCACLCTVSIRWSVADIRHLDMMSREIEFQLCSSARSSGIRHGNGGDGLVSRDTKGFAEVERGNWEGELRVRLRLLVRHVSCYPYITSEKRQKLTDLTRGLTAMLVDGLATVLAWSHPLMNSG
jgi:hypothetical protein